MAYQQISEILMTIDDVLHRIHAADRDRAPPPARFEPAHAGDETPEEMLLQRLDAEHCRLRRLVREVVARDQNEQTMRTWIQYIPADQMQQAATAVIESQPARFDERIDALSGFYRELQQFLMRIQEQTTSLEAEQRLKDVLRQVEFSGKILAAGLNGIRDM